MLINNWSISGAESMVYILLDVLIHTILLHLFEGSMQLLSVIEILASWTIVIAQYCKYYEKVISICYL